ncbi:MULTISPECIES: DUF4304 domain-containing protein [Bacillus]|uniref:DUF4304 domain-containing protein n=2 Tax=Bacillus anthracis TaxID=1392 RepID=A0A4Y1W9Q0_BACAN|nr:MULTISPECIES: DUF4304 domain-containing protein [Bacillus]EJT21152.1 hypothetical protein B353_08756 [Bacillus anthracis str. UR-1]EXJ17514.1 hypothetical protein Y693_25220 [Bacillus anthracis str. 95014]AAP28850.1 hypothetical protein BA_5181 [Bacillus anthracis str. Ames]AAT34311.1 hypothetical protein GBAA_5181 [Bacillus anthracis str. 'Ames Ancestor']AAT57109.1 hypothetical protein BAS4816 [Bacillus anthracis str. Sterne]
MQDFIISLHTALKPLGFKKKRNTFSKAENGFYKLINIQKSQFGDAFYINIGVHPIGLPQLITNQLQIKENISIFDCILRTRIEPIHMNQNQLLHNVSHETIDIPNYLSTIFDWFQTWASYENLAKTNIHSISPLLAVVPILQEKAFLLLTCFSFYNLKQYEQANRYLQQYLHCAVHLNTEEKEPVFFYEIDMYIKKLVESAM